MHTKTVWLSRAAAVLLLAFTAALSSAQTLTTLVNFDGTNGDTPAPGALLLGADGNFYGSTSTGGPNKGGTIFRMTPGGQLTTLYNFPPPSFTGFPGANSSMIQASDGNIYGTTPNYGTDPLNIWGTVFKLTPAGAYSTLYAFTLHGSDGQIPNYGLLQASDGNLYGTTQSGGDHSAGTVFKITLGGQATTVHSWYRRTEH